MEMEEVGEEGWMQMVVDGCEMQQVGLDGEYPHV